MKELQSGVRSRAQCSSGTRQAGRAYPNLSTLTFKPHPRASPPRRPPPSPSARHPPSPPLRWLAASLTSIRSVSFYSGVAGFTPPTPNTDFCSKIIRFILRTQRVNLRKRWPTPLPLRAPPALTAAALDCGFADLNQVCLTLFRRFRIYNANNKQEGPFWLKMCWIYSASTACQFEIRWPFPTTLCAPPALTAAALACGFADLN